MAKSKNGGGKQLQNPSRAPKNSGQGAGKRPPGSDGPNVDTRRGQVPSGVEAINHQPSLDMGAKEVFGMGYQAYVDATTTMSNMAREAMALGGEEEASNGEQLVDQAVDADGQAAGSPPVAPVDENASATFTYKCDGKLGAGDIAKAGGGSSALWTEIRDLNAAGVDINILKDGTELTLPQSWASGLGCEMSSVELSPAYAELLAELDKDNTNGELVKELLLGLNTVEQAQLATNVDAMAEIDVILAAGGEQGWFESAMAVASGAAEQLDAINPMPWAQDAIGEAVGSVTSGVGEQAHGLYDNMNHWWEGSDSTQESEHGKSEAPDAGTELEVEVVDDGFDEKAAMASMDALFDEYTSMSVSVTIGKDPGTVVEINVTAKYRNFGSNDDWLGALAASEAKHGEGQKWDFKRMLKGGKGSDNIEHSNDFAQAYAGKATPEQLSTSIEEAAESGELRQKLDGATDAAAAEQLINEFAQQRLGLDCVGFVWKLIEGTGQLDDFTPTYGAKGKEQLADTTEAKEGWIACRGMMASATDITDKPESWRTMDVILDPTHIIAIYDFTEITLTLQNSVA